jgi:hypothetical protein
VQLDDKLPDGRFPRCLWWNFWAGLRSETDQILRRQWLSMRWLLAQLGSNPVVAVQGGTGRHSTIGSEVAPRLQRLITLAADGSPVPLEVEVLRDQRGVRINLDVMSRQNGETIRVRADFGHVASEWIHTDGESRQSLAGAPATVSFIDRGAGYSLMMEFPWAVLGQSVRTIRELPMLVGVAQQSHSDELIASTLIPLNVIFES